MTVGCSISPVSRVFTLTDDRGQFNKFLLVTFEVSSIAEHRVFHELIMVPLALEHWTITLVVDACSLFESIVPFTVVAVAI